MTFPIFAILRLLIFVLIVAGLIVLGIVLIKAKRKRREKTREAIKEFLSDDNDR